MPTKPIQDDDILFKGFTAGILILINQDLDFEKLIKKLIQRLKKEKKFLSEMELYIKGIDRFLDKDEIGMVRKMVRDKTKFDIKDASVMDSESGQSKSTPIPSSSQTFLQTNPFLIINHSLRAGEEINTNSPVILHGDINPGATLKSPGPVIIIGRIKGDVILRNDDQLPFVFAYGLQPNRLVINSVELSPSGLIEADINTPTIVQYQPNELNIIRMKEDKWEKQL